MLVVWSLNCNLSIVRPRYLNELTCSTDSPRMEMGVRPGVSFDA